MARVIISSDMCKGCGLCTRACPKKILELEKVKINSKGYYPVRCTSADACIGCAACARMCPHLALEVER